jgi:undecaprenyl-diphosphatase
VRPLAWCSRTRSWTASPAGALIAADRHLERWVVHHRIGWIDWLFVGLSWIGTDGAIFLVAAGVLAILWRKPWLFVLVLAADLVADALSYGLREWIGRRRPPFVYPEPKPLVHTPHSGSFPSGHAAIAFACATVIAWCVPRLAFPAFALAAAIAWSRVYVGVHWPLDVLGGAALGILVATALLMLAGALRRSRPATRTG